MSKNLKEIAAEIAEKNKKLKSLAVKLHTDDDGNDYITFSCCRYHGQDCCITGPQVDYIKRLCDYVSSSNLRKLNKYCASAIITAVKEYDLTKDETYVVA